MAGHRPYPPASAPPPKQHCLRVKLLPESPDDDANDDAISPFHWRKRGFESFRRRQIEQLWGRVGGVPMSFGNQAHS